MKMRNLLLILLCVTFSESCVAVEGAAGADVDPLTASLAAVLSTGIKSGADVIKWVGQTLVNMKKPYVALGVVSIFGLALIQKENPEFFSTGARYVEWPFMWTFRKLEQAFSGGRSLTWNEVASWHNRVSRLLTPLTKTTSMVDLSKDRRLRIMDQEEGADEGQDHQWKKQVAHIEREFGFMIKILTIRLAYYKDLSTAQTKKPTNALTRAIKAPVNKFNDAGKAFVRMSLIRNEEVAFGLEEAITYLTETIEYCKSVSHFSALDKEHMKRLVGNICTTFEHIGVLVDELSAADKNKKKIQMTADGSLSRSSGYAGSGAYGSYDSSYGGNV